jgi:hypothetical protein
MMKIGFVAKHAVIGGMTLIAVMVLSDKCLAQTPAYCWIDAETGNPAPLGPPGWSSTGAGPNPYASNPDPNHVSYGGRNFVKLPDGSWIDAATGKPAPLGPPGWSPTGAGPNRYASNPDHNHVSYGGRNFVRVPCPKKARKEQDDTEHRTAVRPVPDISIGIGIGGERRDDRGNDRGRDSGFGIGGGGITFGR